MRAEFLVVLFFTLLNCQQAKVNDENSNNLEISDECSKGKTEALKDFDNKILGLYLFGLPGPQLSTRISVLKQYNIVIKGGGDIITEDGKCYNAVMEKKIEEKYGDDFFSIIDRKIDSLYSSGLGDRDLEYPGGREALRKFIACNLDYSVVSQKSSNPSVYVNLLIDTIGTVKQATVVKGVNGKVDSEALRVSRMLSGWTAAIQNRRKVDSQVTVQVKFDLAEKAKLGCQ